MREANWYKMLVVSAVLHVFIIGAFSIPLKKSMRRSTMSYYSVNLVGDIGGPSKAAPAPAAAVAPPRPPEQKKEGPKKEPKKTLQKEKVVATTKEKSLAPKKKNEPIVTTKDEVRTLDQKIREMRSRTQYMDVSGKKEGSPGKGPALPGVASGGTGPFDPVLQKYYADVWEKIQASWHAPSMSASKNLLTIVSIKIRKDGKITDWTIEQRSGNRAYDESISRALRSVEALPPIPGSLNTDFLEIGFNFHPPGDIR